MRDSQHTSKKFEARKVCCDTCSCHDLHSVDKKMTMTTLRKSKLRVCFLPLLFPVESKETEIQNDCLCRFHNELQQHHLSVCLSEFLHSFTVISSTSNDNARIINEWKQRRIKQSVNQNDMGRLFSVSSFELNAIYSLHIYSIR